MILQSSVNNFRGWPLCALLIVSTAACGGELSAEICSNDFTLSTTPSSDFEVAASGNIIRHNETGLEWQRCSLGQTWDGTFCTGSASTHTWPEALELAMMASGSWRLPNIKELQSIVEFCRHSPAINREVFPSTSQSWFWSASPFIGNSDFAWAIRFYDGNDQTQPKNNAYQVRLVRGGQ